MKKTLILLNDNYPLSTGEFFIDDEMKVLELHFESIYVLTRKQKQNRLSRYIPKNLVIETYNDSLSWLDKVVVVKELFSSLFLDEKKNIRKKYNLKLTLLLLKIMVNDIAKSSKLIKAINHLIINNNLNLNNVIFYSYWHDYKALALARMKEKNDTLKCVSRAHRWDIYFNVNTPPYLPFKKYIIKNLNSTITISKDGFDEFKSIFKSISEDKLTISRLGKFNNRKLNIKKRENNVYRICSCSTLKEVKRVHLIIESLSLIKNTNIEWIHFGDGILKKNLIELAERKLKDISFRFTGNVSNEKILNFYEENYVDLFINTSESEGIPVSIMEALSAGIPVLATDVGGNREVVNNKVGRLIKKISPKEISEQIIEFISLDLDSIIKTRNKAYQHWKENYNAALNYDSFVKNLMSL